MRPSATQCALVLGAALALAACTVSTGDTGNTGNDSDSQTYEPLEYLKKYYPTLSAAPKIEPEAIKVGENVVVSVVSPSGAHDARVMGLTGVEPNGGGIAIQESGNGQFTIPVGVVKMVKPGTYYPAVAVSTLTRTEQQTDAAQHGEMQARSIFYTFNPKISSTHYAVTASCTGEWSYCGEEDATGKIKEILVNGIASDLPLTKLVVTAPEYDFAVVITGVSVASGSNIKIWFELTNNSPSAETVKVGVWPNRTIPPTEGLTPGTWWDQPIAVGETLVLSSTEYLIYSTGVAYHPYVFVDWDAAFVESVETNNISTLTWTAP